MRHLSIAARLNIAAGLLVTALIIVFLVIPFYSDRAQAREDKQLAAAAQVVRAQQGQQFLHKFDCTFGRSLKQLLDEAARSWTEQSAVTLASWRAARAAGDDARARVAKASHENAVQSAAEYTRLRNGIKRLDGPAPCPTTP